MKKILLFGGSGLVGSGLKQFLSNKYQIIVPTHNKADVTERSKIVKFIEHMKPDNIIYAVGMASIDKAEEDPNLAYLLNAKVPAFLAKTAKNFAIPFLYFSTNAVFDGTKKDRAYKETDKTNPVSIYGKSKLMGEQMVMYISDKHCVARIIMPYSTITSKRKNFALVILDALRKGKRVYGIIDQVINPIYISSLADAVDALIKNSARGIYHLGATNYTTNIKFTKKLAGIFNLNENLIREISFKEFYREKKAARTKFCWLDTSKFKNEINNDILISIEDSLKLFHHSLIDSPPVPIDIFR